jgi:hypothetical protein
MRINFGRTGLFISLLLISACSSMQVKLPVKYDLGNKLEQVAEIKDMRIGGGRGPSFTEFNKPDKATETLVGERGQSLRELQGHENFDFESAPAIIAKRDTFTLSETQNQWIKVDNQSLILRNGPNEFYLLVLQRPAYDLMTVDTISIVNTLNTIRAKNDLVGVGGRQYIIERIYRIDGNDKMLAIKNQLVG